MVVMILFSYICNTEYLFGIIFDMLIDANNNFKQY